MNSQSCTTQPVSCAQFTIKSILFVSLLFLISPTVLAAELECREEGGVVATVNSKNGKAVSEKQAQKKLKRAKKRFRKAKGNGSKKAIKKAKNRVKNAKADIATVKACLEGTDQPSDDTGGDSDNDPGDEKARELRQVLVQNGTVQLVMRAKYFTDGNGEDRCVMTLFMEFDQDPNVVYSAVAYDDTLGSEPEEVIEFTDGPPYDNEYVYSSFSGPGKPVVKVVISAPPGRNQVRIPGTIFEVATLARVCKESFDGRANSASVENPRLIM